MRQLAHLLGIVLESLQQMQTLMMSQLLQQLMRLLLKTLNIPPRKKVLRPVHNLCLPLLL